MKPNTDKQQQVWNALARQWSSHRQKPWKDVENLMSLLLKSKPGRILDIGCGNGRNLLPFAMAGFDCYGIDFSEEMLKSAEQFAEENKINLKLKYGRAQLIPFPTKSLDYALSIAVLHHLKKEDHLRALHEMFRVLKDNGKAVITVWNHLNPKFFKFILKKQTFVPWKLNDQTYWRYYYFFSFWELRRLIRKAGFRILKSSSPFARNLIFVLEKNDKI